MTAASSPIRLFFSYAHRPADHKQAVRAMAARFASISGFEVRIDEQVEKLPVGPPEGWPAWMEQQVSDAQWILVFCNAAYAEAWSRTGGLGSTWEAGLIRQELYESRGLNTKVIPVLMDAADRQHIPAPLRGSTHYLIPDQEGTLVSALLRTTWLGSLMQAMGTPTPTAQTRFEQIHQVTAQSDENPFVKRVLDQCQALCQELEQNYPVQNSSAVVRDAAKFKFSKQFCPLAKDLLQWKGSLPPPLDSFYDMFCA